MPAPVFPLSLRLEESVTSRRENVSGMASLLYWQILQQSDSLPQGGHQFLGENIMPWALIPFLWLISYSVRLDPDISWNIQSLIIPVSAWIGYRYGIKGVMAVFYASVPLFLFQLNGDVEGLSMRFGADGGTLSTALAFAWFVSSPGNTAALDTYLREKPRRLWLCLPFTFYLSFNDNFRFSLNSSLSLDAAFFLIGFVWSRADFRRLWLVVGSMFVLGIAVTGVLFAASDFFREMQEFGRIRYMFAAPQDIVSIVIFLFAGSWCRSFWQHGPARSEETVFASPKLLLAMIIFSYLHVGLWTQLDLGADFMGDHQVTVLCCFLAGFFYRKRGFIIVFVPVVILSLLSTLFPDLADLGTTFLAGELEIYIWSSQVGQGLSELPAFFLWCCVGSQLRAFIGNEPRRIVAPVRNAGAVVSTG